MDSSPSPPLTPNQNRNIPPSLTNAMLSPPSSQGRPVVQSTSANINGKRPLSTLEPSFSSNESSNAITTTTSTANDAGSRVENQQSEEQSINIDKDVKIHHKSGYTWSKSEDEPGYTFMNKRALEESERAWSCVLGKERKIGSKSIPPTSHFDK